jgi:hypothetical protein
MIRNCKVLEVALPGFGIATSGLTLMLVQKFRDTDMSEPAGKALRRTFHGMSTHLADPCSTPPWVRSSHYPEMSNKPPCKTLKSGLSMAVYAAARLKIAYWILLTRKLQKLG